MTYLNKTYLIKECRRVWPLVGDPAGVIVRGRKDVLIEKTTPGGYESSMELRYTSLLKYGRLAVPRMRL